MSSRQLVRLPGVEITQEGDSQDPGVKNTEMRDKTRSFVSGRTGQGFDILTREVELYHRQNSELKGPQTCSNQGD